MAGFFGLFDYTKPGPGVPKDAPQKPRPLLFFDIFFRKFWNIMKLNLLYTIFNIPGLVIAFFGIHFMFPDFIVDETIDMYLRPMMGALFICIPALCFGPAQAGLTYCLRNYAREEHAFVWGDFKEHALKNVRQGLIVCLIDFVIFMLLGISFYFYGNMSGTDNNLAVVALGVIGITFTMFMMTRIYIYPMLVTFEIKIFALYKNALIFAVIRFLPNLGILLLCAAIIMVSLIIAPVGILLFILILNGLICFLLNFYSWPTIKKYMVDRAET